MPIIKDESENNERILLFEIVASGSNPFVLLPAQSINFLISGQEAFSLQKPYKILESRLEKRIDSLLLSDGTNTVNFSQLWTDQRDEISIQPDFSIPIEKGIFGRFSKFSLQPSSLIVGTRIRTGRLQDMGIGANPTLSWNISYQVFFRLM